MLLLRIISPFLWTRTSLCAILFVCWLQIPQNSFATNPCNNIQSTSFVFSCPNGNQGYLAVFSDGCHTLIKYESCRGRYHEFYCGIISPSHPNTGDGNLNELFEFIMADSEQLQAKSSRNNNDVKNFLVRTVNQVLKDKRIEKIENMQEGVKGKTSLNSADQAEISAFELMIDKESKREEKKDVKKDDK